MYYGSPPDYPEPKTCESCGEGFDPNYEPEYRYNSRTCAWCDYIPGASACTMERVTFHTAAKDYPDARIAKGDRYGRIVRGDHVIGGPRWLSVERIPAPTPEAFYMRYESRLHNPRGSYDPDFGY